MENKEFLHWLANRLVFKHGYSSDDQVVVTLSTILNEDKKQEIKLGDDEIDMIISKYYADFFLEKTPDMNIGYTNNERDSIRSNIKSIVVDIINNNIPKQDNILK